MLRASKATSAKVPVIKVQNGGSPSLRSQITFEKVFRAKLHKNTKYMDELRAEALLERAARVIRACYLPGCRPEKDGGMSYEAARAILDAFEAATGGSA